MSDALKPIKRGFKILTHPGKYLLHPVRAVKDFVGAGGGSSDETGGPPTIDTAAQNRAAMDRIRMRRGVLANIYGGSGGAAPSVGAKSLMGQ